MRRSALTPRQIDPYHLTYFDGGFYLVARCHLRAAPRTFAVERIRAIRSTGLHFVRPRDFDPQAFFHDCWGIIQGDRTTVRLRFSREHGRYVVERLWHPSQEIQWLSDGRLELTLKVADTLDLKRWVLGYGREVEVLEPVALREEIRQEGPEAIVRRVAPARRPAVAVTRPVTVRGYKGGAGPKLKKWTAKSS